MSAPTVPQAVIDAMRSCYLALDRVNSTIAYGDEIACGPLDDLDAAYRCLGLEPPETPHSYEDE